MIGCATEICLRVELVLRHHQQKLQLDHRLHNHQYIRQPKCAKNNNHKRELRTNSSHELSNSYFSLEDSIYRFTR